MANTTYSRADIADWRPEDEQFWDGGGKASVFKYISDDYPTNIGTISGIVGLAGGLGGFVLPIMFGALMDLTGIRSSAFMLMYGVVWVSLIWMFWTEVRGREMMGQNAKPFAL